MKPLLLYLIQTDTTVGFASQNDNMLNSIKSRIESKKLLRTVPLVKNIKTRVPKQRRKMVRNASKSTFIYSDNSAKRVVFNGPYHDFLKNFAWMYSTSANLSGKGFSKEWAEKNASVIVHTNEEFKSKSASSIFRFSKTKIKKIR